MLEYQHSNTTLEHRYVLDKCRAICNVDTSRSAVLKLGPVRALLPNNASHDKISAFVKWILEDVRSLCSSSCDSRSVGTYLYHHFGSTTLSTALELFNEYVNHPSMMSKARRLFVAISIAICESKSLEHAIPSTKDLTSVLFPSLQMAYDSKREVRSASWNVLWKLSSNRKHRNTIAFQALKLRLDGHLGGYSLFLISLSPFPTPTQTYTHRRTRHDQSRYTTLERNSHRLRKNKQHVSLRSVQVLAVHVSSEQEQEE